MKIKLQRVQLRKHYHLKNIIFATNIKGLTSSARLQCTRAESNLEDTLCLSHIISISAINFSKEKDEEMEVDPPAKPDTPVQSTPDSAGPEEADNANASNDTPALPASLQFLRTAHEQLGRYKPFM